MHETLCGHSAGVGAIRCTGACYEQFAAAALPDRAANVVTFAKVADTHSHVRLMPELNRTINQRLLNVA